ncbi:NB-ARC domain-containing protein [Actinokineospora enzanensis]|uniref:NB-ARC domain-containing protein n=1 Tax=Actinokineospora enzanensis TaxID=155975 RepID=UPI00039A513F|nr:NB-ARC domain-containing protein [Actinokineospora enzanensis]
MHNEVSGTVHGTVIQAHTVTVSAGAPRSVWMVPTPDRPLVERAAESTRLHDLVTSGEQLIGVVGPGGFGKTTLVIQLCHRLRAAFPGGILWVTLGEHVPDPVLADKLNDLCELLGARRPTLTDPNMAGHRLRELLTSREPALLVVDDVWAASRLTPFLGHNTPVITTSRARGALPPAAKIVPVSALSPSESRILLTLGIDGLTRTEELLKLTGRWAILLSLVNSAIRQSVEEGDTPDDAASLVAEQLRLDGPDSLDMDSADRRDSAIRATVEASLHRLSPDDRERFRELAVFPEDTDIPTEVVHLLWASVGLSPARCRKLVRLLRDSSLIAASPSAVRLHDVLRAYLRQVLGDALPGVHARLVAALRTEIPGEWDTARPYTLHHLATHAAESGLLDRLLLDAGFLLAADQPGVLTCLDQARTPEAKRAATAYRRAAHHLRDRPEHERPAYLELAARQEGATDLADEAGELATDSPWRCDWAHWNPGLPHRILDRHDRMVDEIALVPLPDGRLWVVSRSRNDVRVVDADTNEAVRPPWPMLYRQTSAIACVPLPDGRHAIVAGSTSGMVRAWYPESGEPLRWTFSAPPDTDDDLWDLPEPVLSPEWDVPDEVIQHCPADQRWEPTDDADPWEDDYPRWSARFDAIECEFLGLCPPPDRFETAVECVVWDNSPGDPVVVVAAGGVIRMWDPTAGRLAATRIEFRNAAPFRANDLAPRRLVDGRAVVVVDTRAVLPFGQLPADFQWPFDLTTGARLALSEADEEMPLLVLPDGAHLKARDLAFLSNWSDAIRRRLGVPQHPGGISATALCMRGGEQAMVATGGFDGVVRLWDLQVLLHTTWPTLDPSTQPTDLVRAGEWIVTAHEGYVRVRDASGEVTRELSLESPPTSLVPVLAPSEEADPPLVVMTFRDSPVRVWNVDTGEVDTRDWTPPAQAITCVRTTDARTVLLTATATSRLDAWDLVTGNRLWMADGEPLRGPLFPFDPETVEITVLAMPRDLLLISRPRLRRHSFEVRGAETGSVVEADLLDDHPLMTQKLAVVPDGEESLVLSLYGPSEPLEKGRLPVACGRGHQAIPGRRDCLLWNGAVVLTSAEMSSVVVGRSVDVLDAWTNDVCDSRWSTDLAIHLDTYANMVLALEPDRVVVATDQGLVGLRLW